MLERAAEGGTPRSRKLELAGNDIGGATWHDADGESALMCRGHHFRNHAIAAGGEHQVKLLARERRPNRLDVQAGAGLEHRRFPAELARKLEQTPTKLRAGSRQRGIHDEQGAPPVAVAQSRRASSLRPRSQASTIEAISGSIIQQPGG